MSLKYTLITDGPSDRALLSVLNWVCREQYPGPVESQWFDPRPLSASLMPLGKRLRLSIELYPCNILFVHRDSEGQDPQTRYDEISEAAESLSTAGESIPFICVVPVRMTEAWFLFDEKAIRWASGNPNGKTALDLPILKTVERLPDPKSRLFESLKTASGLNTRRQKKLKLSQCRLRLAERIVDFSPLRVLPAFQRLENDVQSFCRVLNENGFQR
ncbi:DUF4276 family protein [Desulfosarcina ovata]|uniref:DUF4276 family protein n=1 Tax=Desulfosarcina ovata TaxID=83564 RepID=UPI0012D348F5|nr:DUF4276 family protein [Desulfosarcina ovata]